MLTVSIRNGMGTATISGSSVVLTGAKESDFMYYSSDFLFGGVQSNQDGDYLVTQNSPTGMSVLAAAGTCYVPQTAYAKNGGLTKTWRVENDATTSALTIAANGSGSARVDLVCVKVDTAVTPDGEATNVATVVVVTGTPGAGVPATPSNYLKLAEVAVANGASSITNANITDKRIQAWMAPLNAPAGYMQNGIITPTVSSNNLTVAIKTYSGDDPSATNPVFVTIGGVVRKITAALSVTKNAGTNWFNSGATETATLNIDYYVYLAWDATNSVVRIGFARTAYNTIYSQFNATTTNERYGAFNTNPSAADNVELVGRFAAIITATASFNWSVPTFTNENLRSVPTRTGVWRDFAPVYSAFGGMTYTSVSTGKAQYRMDGDEIEIRFNHTGTLGGTPSSIVFMTIPFQATSDDASTFISAGYNLSSGFLGGIQPNGTVFNLNKADATVYATGSGKQFTGYIRFLVK